jgi:hypothetical protein
MSKRHEQIKAELAEHGIEMPAGSEPALSDKAAVMRCIPVLVGGNGRARVQRYQLVRRDHALFAWISQHRHADTAVGALRAQDDPRDCRIFDLKAAEFFPEKVWRCQGCGHVEPAAPRGVAVPWDTVLPLGVSEPCTWCKRARAVVEPLEGHAT